MGKPRKVKENGPPKVEMVEESSIKGKKRKILSEMNVPLRETRSSKRLKLQAETIKNEQILKNENTNDENESNTTLAKVKKNSTKNETEPTLYKTPEEILNSGKSAIEILNMKSLMQSFSGQDPDQFFDHCRQFMNISTMQSAEVLTIEQADTPLWFEMRYGRITASRVHQASRCKTMGGSLVDSIMGKRSGWSFAMQRGTNLEDQVFSVLKKDMASKGHTLKQCGLFLDASLPHFGASPDGIAEEFVVEIKCPATQKTYEEYIDVNKLQRKYYGQIQLQMRITNRKKALLGVADLNFERNRKVVQVWIDYDEEYVNQLIEDANEFWVKAVYPLLKRKHFKN